MERVNERYIETVKLLNNTFDFINDRFFANELQKVVITVQADEKNKAYGWFSLKKVWKENADDIGAHEINISAQFLNRPLIDICETMLHEMCHLYASQNNLKDCSRSGTYHNKLFKQIAETHGLKCECVATIGWSATALTDDSKIVLQTFLDNNSDSVIYRLPKVSGVKVKSSSTRKYICPVCGMSVRATKEVRLICADCNEPMTEE
ncbi:MAG: SprT-like domain-containing protein [Christensenellaceae bacterium]